MNRTRTWLWLQALECRAVPATFTVTNTNDAGAGSLRRAVLDSNSFAGADNVVFDAMAFATAKTITLSTGQMTIADAVTITGPANEVIIDATKASRIFNVPEP